MRGSILMLFFLTSISTCLFATEPVEADLSPRQAQIEAAILYIMDIGFPEHKIYPNRGNPLYRNRARRAELVRAIDEASTRYPVPPMFLVAMAFREGSFVGKKPGDLGELSTFQIIPRTARIIRKRHEPECTLDTVQGSALCAAAWLAHWTPKCGSLHGAFVIYATGKRCKPVTPHLIWMLRDRFGIARKLEGITGYTDRPDSLTLISNSDSNENS